MAPRLAKSVPADVAQIQKNLAGANCSRSRLKRNFMLNGQARETFVSFAIKFIGPRSKLLAGGDLAWPSWEWRVPWSKTEGAMQ